MERPNLRGSIAARRLVAGLIAGLVAGGAAGCAARAEPRAPAAGADALAAPYALRPAPVAPARPAPPSPADDAARALGIPRLRDVTLPAGVRELRVSDSYEMIAGTPAPVLRIVERPGEAAAGQVWFVWAERAEWGVRRRGVHRARCTPWQDGARRCAFVARAAVDWPIVAARLDTLGAWTLGARCEDGGYVTDSGDLLLGRLAGERAEDYACNAPRYRRSTAAGRASLALYEYVQAVVRQADPAAGG